MRYMTSPFCRFIKAAAAAFGVSMLALTAAAAGEIDPAGSGYKYKVAHSFKGNDGNGPQYGDLVQGADGFFYGTTYAGGAFNFGVAYKMSASGEVTVLHEFNNDGVDGTHPQGGLSLANDGNLYGTTPSGGAHELGIVYRLTPAGALTVLHSFGPGVQDGASPAAPPIQASDGNFYGTTVSGGNDVCGNVYRLTPVGELTNLRTFKGAYADGCNPVARLTQASDGMLYGTTAFGGAADLGTVFRLTLTGSLKTLHSFDGVGGSFPFSAVTEAADGNFYGTTSYGGIDDLGTAFRMTPGGKFTLLHQFNAGSGAYVFAGLVQAADGKLYGTASSGGDSGHGTVFQMSTKGAVKVLHSFGTSSDDGWRPYSGLALAADGSLHGTTYYGGRNGVGTAFQLKPKESATR